MILARRALLRCSAATCTMREPREHRRDASGVAPLVCAHDFAAFVCRDWTATTECVFVASNPQHGATVAVTWPRTDSAADGAHES